MMHHKKDICIPGNLDQSVRPEYDTMHHRKDICIPGYVDSKAYDPEYNSDAPPYETHSHSWLPGLKMYDPYNTPTGPIPRRHNNGHTPGVDLKRHPPEQRPTANGLRQ